MFLHQSFIRRHGWRRSSQRGGQNFSHNVPRVREVCRVQRRTASIINPYPRYSKPFSTKNAANLGEATDRERSRVPAVTRSRAQDDCNDVHGFGIPLTTGTRCHKLPPHLRQGSAV